MVKRKNNFYRSRSLIGVSEIDLRKEFINTELGNGCEIGKFQTGFLRKFRRDSNNDRIRCHCVDPVTCEPDRERKCSTCLGEGYTWDEEYINFYHAEVNNEVQRSHRETLRAPGLMNTDVRVFYLDYTATLTEVDKLILLELDKEGKIVEPVTRKKMFVTTSLEPLRLDNGRIEFWKLNGYEDNNKHL